MTGNYTLPRTGLPPLEFAGELVAAASSATKTGPLCERWHEVTVYRTRSGWLVAAVSYRTRRVGEHDHHAATTCTARGAVAWLAGYGALAAVGLLRTRPAERAVIRREIYAGFQRAVSAALAGFPEVVS